MVRKRASSRVADDFTRIHGIGPITGKHLHSAGIHTFADLAALSADRIASLVPRLSKKQVARQRWIEQAHRLASGGINSSLPEKESAPSTSRQHYENFTLEFLLGEKNKIRRLQIVHIQSGDVDTWTKWDTDRLVDFLSRHTGTRLHRPKVIPLPAGKSGPASIRTKTLERPPEVTMEAASASHASLADNDRNKTAPEPTPDLSADGSQADQTSAAIIPTESPSPAGAVSRMNRIQLLEWKTLLNDSREVVHNLPHDRCFDVDLTLDLADAPQPINRQLDCTALLSSRKLGGGYRQVIGEMRSTVPYASTIKLTITHASLAPGLYRLEAFLTLVPAGLPLSDKSVINTTFQGGLFQVY